MPVTEYLEPTTVEEACRLVADDPFTSTALAGGTAVGLMMRQGLIAPDRLVSLAAVAGLNGIREHNGTVIVGAGTTLAGVASSALVRERLPSLAHAAGSVANVRVRNVATLGGNLAEADYASDPPAVLASLGATCTIRGTSGSRTIPVDEFITGFYTTALQPGELLTSVVVPAPPNRAAVYLKYVTRSSEDRPCVGVAARADDGGGTVRALDVVVGAVADRPQRVAEACAWATGRRLTEELIAEIAAAYRSGIEPMDDIRGSAWYRGEMIAVFVRRALLALADRYTEGLSNG